MSRYYWSSKTEADGLKKIQNWWLKKHGYFRGYWSSGTIKWTSSLSNNESTAGVVVVINNTEKSLRIYYTITKENRDKKDFDYKIPLTTTPCYFGGQRYWFICPWYRNGVYCGKRVGTLYLKSEYFACRHCYQLSYSSKNQSRSALIATLDIIFKGKKIAEKQANLRIKKWRGKPTKRYQKLEDKGWALTKKAEVGAAIGLYKNR